jgi:pre-mRNA-splicing helicase BRR2
MSDDDDGGMETRADRNLEAQEGEQMDGGVEDELPVGTIDAYWLQRELGKFFNDPMEAQKAAEDVLETLVEAEERDCENKLVVLLDYDKFDLIKLLLKHR